MITLSERESRDYCDNLLWQLYSGDRMGSDDNDEDFEKDYICVSRLFNDGYVVVFGKTEESRAFSFRITPSGVAFIGTGGYKARYKKEVSQKRNDNIRYWITTIVAIGAAITSLVALLK